VLVLGRSVVPAEAGPSKHIAKLLISVINHVVYWIPACAGMTVWNPCLQHALDLFTDSLAGTALPAVWYENALTVCISQALPSDAPDLAQLHAGALPPGWPAADIAAFCDRSSRIVLKAMDGAVLLGFAILQFAADEAEILTIAVAQQAQRRGIGSLIMERAIAICEERFVSCIYLEAAESNGPALGLYKKFGFSVLAHRKNYYLSARPTPETALIMRLDIKHSLSQIEPEKGEER
jgi:ribosomal-protein-alanine N-acetyltransferase